jgi:hypothetical protein
VVPLQRADFQILVRLVNPPHQLKVRTTDFYNNSDAKLNFGWLSDKFVSNIGTYSNAEQIDGTCPFEWRQGIKHDCSSIMELDKVNGHFVNGLKEVIGSGFS